MKLRGARHTTDLQTITSFYTDILGLEVLGNFAGHDGYDGVFIGPPKADWHLEFTVSADVPVHQPDEDDLLVLYPENRSHFDLLIAKIKGVGIAEVTAKNPYWQANGITYTDPDGYRVVIARRN